MTHFQLLGSSSWRAFAVALTLAGVSGCSNPAAQWHRNGVANSQRDADYDACRAEARDASQAGVDEDMAASRASISHEPGGAPPTAGVNYSASRAASEALITCMTDKGYHGS